MKIKSINPYNNEVNGEFELLEYSEIEKEISTIRSNFHTWKNTSIQDRAKLMKKLGEILRKNKDKYAEIMAKEMGKPIKEGKQEVEKCAWLCDYYSENGEEFLKEDHIKTEAKKSYVRFDPIGIVFAIMPWNFPFWQVIRAAVPAMLVGNVVILKHASNVPMSALAIEESFKEAGFPDVFKTLIINSTNAMKIVEDDLVDGVTLTGSNRAGESIGKIAGNKIKKVVLELGGSDPFIVLETANIDKAVNAAITSRYKVNAGQSCISAKRFIVMEEVAKEFETKFIQELKKLKIGDPLDENTEIGPVASMKFKEDLTKQLQDAEDKGGKVFKVNEDEFDNAIFVPCVVPNATKDMKIMREEVFGPIAPIFIVKNHEQAIEIANDSIYGLGCSIFSENTDEAEIMATKIDSGTVAINDFMKSDPRLPFGGTKKSGLGREMSYYGIKEFANIKTVVVR